MKKFFRAFFILLLIIICFVFFYTTIHNINFSRTETTLVEVFKSTGADAVSSEIYFWSDLEDILHGMDELEDLAGAFSGALKLKDDMLTRSIRENQHIQTVEISGTDAEGRLINISIQQEKEAGDTGECFISVSVMHDMLDEGLEEIKNTVMEVFAEHNLDARVNSCITGTFEGKLGDKEIDEIRDRVLKAAGARKVEGLAEEHLISVSAYSPAMGDGVKSGNRSINLNLAIRYNAFEDKTYI